MKVVAFSIKPFEKICLARANTKKHDITLISNSLSPATSIYAEGKDAVIVFTSDDVSEKVIGILAGYGIKYIITRSTATGHIDKVALDKCGIQLLNVKHYPDHSNAVGNGHPVAFLSGEATQQIADQTIRNLDSIQQKVNL